MSENDVVIYEPTPLVRMMESMRKDEKSYLRDAQARSELRHSLWINTMLDDSEDTTTRLRASELSARADGEFNKIDIVSGAATIREMFLSISGELKELYPKTENAMICADALDDPRQTEIDYILVDDAEEDY